MDAEHLSSLAKTLTADSPQTHVALPRRADVSALVDQVLGVLFPELALSSVSSDSRSALADIEDRLTKLLAGLVPDGQPNEIAAEFLDALPTVQACARRDAEAIQAGDPATESLDEVIAAYPGFLAIAVFRIAHELHARHVRILPRLFTEFAHARTGIDIHPGATIGESFCIDHGTGIVIGETTKIGSHVKLYQGVTLGALSVLKATAGTKRHPTIEDRVVIYANATVLGGETTVGHDSIIGGNVWLTNSVPPDSFVYHTSEVRIRNVSEAAEPSDFVI